MCPFSSVLSPPHIFHIISQPSTVLTFHFVFGEHITVAIAVLVQRKEFTSRKEAVQRKRQTLRHEAELICSSFFSVPAVTRKQPATKLPEASGNGAKKSPLLTTHPNLHQYLLLLLLLVGLGTANLTTNNKSIRPV